MRTLITFSRCHDYRFMKGLNCLGLLEEMKKCPSGFAELFLYQGNALTAGLLLNEIFTNIKRSERGSNSWAKESEVIAFWRDYLCDVEGNFCSRLTIYFSASCVLSAACFLPTE